ncbi:MAG: DNA translocase FtsK 4TM domain-containing protein [Lachnospiraceae bacterium]
MATSKKRTTNQTNRKPGRPKKTETQPLQENFIRAELLIILSFALAVLLFLSNFHLCGAAGDFFRTVQLGIFGLIGYAVPILLFTGTCFYMSNQGNLTAARKLAAVIVAAITLCAFMQLFFGITLTAEQSLLEYYHSSSANGAGGGLVGGLVCHVLISVLGKVGAGLVLFVLFLISIVFITERSVVKVVQKSGNAAYQHARDDIDRRRERNAIRREEQQRLREEQRVRGVNLDSTYLTVPEPELEEESAYIPEPQQSEALAASSADVFSGNIALPQDYADEDSVPFETDIPAAAFAVTEELDLPPTSIPVPTPAAEEMPNHIQIEAEDEYYQTDASEKGVNYDGFFIPEEPKRVVTASGKVIDTDTEALQKKLETKRQEAKENGDLSVSQQIQEKQEEPKKEYIFPPVSLLKRGSRTAGSFSDKIYKETAIKLQQTLRDFGVGVTVTNISCGPSVTRYELHPEQGVKVSRIVGLADDIKLSLAAEDIRIEAPIPGKSAVGIEVPNKENNMVYLRDLFEAESFKKHSSRLAFAVGKDIGGQVVVTDIAKMPHMLIAGATGSGKSVCINTLIMSIIFKSSPDDVKLIMVDPKVVELSVYNGIPHLLIPVVTDPKKASGALNWAVAEMTDRYKKFAEYNVRDLKGYNSKVEGIKDIDDENKPKKLPQIVIIVDELADLMMVAPGEVEDAICRLAQLARAAGIHLVIATQRPSVNVITGLIKANVPSRVAFAVSSGVDSRTIIDMNGAEKLLGKGDMLFYPSGFPKPQRVQGAFVSDQEVQKVVDFLTQQGLSADYRPDVEQQINTAPAAVAGGSGGSGRDEYFVQAGKFIVEKEKASIGMLQRVFKIGFNRAARIMDQLSEAGIVGEEEGTKPRKVLVTMEELEELMQHLDE